MNEKKYITTLKVLRAKNDISLYGLQLKTGLLKSKLFKMEKRNQLDRERYADLLALAEAFNMTIDDLIEQNKQDRQETDQQ